MFNEVERKSKSETYLDVAKALAERGTCLKRNYGAVIVGNDEIISTGYTGTPRGFQHCVSCARKDAAPGTNYDHCMSVHAEMNAMISACRKDMIGSTLYLYGIEKDTGVCVNGPEPCFLCRKMIINAGIDKICMLKNGKLIEKSVSTYKLDDMLSNPEISVSTDITDTDLSKIMNTFNAK